MSGQLMVLPHNDPARVRLVRVPEDVSAQEAYRYVTGLIAELPAADGEPAIDAVLDALEDHGFERLDFILGPALD